MQQVFPFLILVTSYVKHLNNTYIFNEGQIANDYLEVQNFIHERKKALKRILMIAWMINYPLIDNMINCFIFIFIQQSISGRHFGGALCK